MRVGVTGFNFLEGHRWLSLKRIKDTQTNAFTRLKLQTRNFIEIILCHLVLLAKARKIAIPLKSQSNMTLPCFEVTILLQIDSYTCTNKRRAFINEAYLLDLEDAPTWNVNKSPIFRINKTAIRWRKTEKMNHQHTYRSNYKFHTKTQHTLFDKRGSRNSRTKKISVFANDKNGEKNKELFKSEANERQLKMKKKNKWNEIERWHEKRSCTVETRIPTTEKPLVTAAALRKGKLLEDLAHAHNTSRFFD